MSDQGINQEQEQDRTLETTTSETSTDVSESSNTNFERSDDIYREAATTEITSPQETAPGTETETAVPEEEAPALITAADISLNTPEPDQVEEVAVQEDVEPAAPPSPEPVTPDAEPSLAQQGLNLLSSWCSSVSDYCKSYAEENPNTLWGTAASWLSWGLSGISSFVDSVSSYLSDPVDTTSGRQDDRQHRPEESILARSILEEPEQAKEDVRDDIGPETGDILILKNDRIRKLKELADLLHQALEEYRAQEEEREDKEEQDEIEEYHDYREELTEIVTEIQKVVPNDSPEVRELLESYEHKVLHEDLPPDVLYQQAMDLIEEIREREEADQVAA